MATNRITREDRITYWIANVRLLAGHIEANGCLQRNYFIFFLQFGVRAYVGIAESKEEFIRYGCRSF